MSGVFDVFDGPLGLFSRGLLSCARGSYCWARSLPGWRRCRATAALGGLIRAATSYRDERLIEALAR